MQSDDLYIALDRDGEVPLYTQISKAIRARLTQSGEADSPFVLPPQRELAQRLRVSRNTVAMAYAELEREGRIVSQVGKGTTAVSPSDQVESRGRQGTLMKSIQRSAEEALALDFTLDEYEEAVLAYLREKKEMLRHIRLAFVECNREQLTYFAKELHLDPGVVIVPFLLNEIREHPVTALESFKTCDVVATSFYHIEEIEGMLKRVGMPVVAVTLQPVLATIVSIARIPPGSRIGLVGASSAFLSEIGRTLRDIRVPTDLIAQTTATDESALAAFVEDVDALIVSPSRRKDVEDLRGDKPLVEFLFAPDDTSIKNLRIVLMDLKHQRKDGK